MRMLRYTWLLGMTSVLATTPVAAQAAAQSAPNLTAPYSMTSGDYAATLLSEVFKLDANLDASPVVVFTPQANAIDVELFGSQGTVEGARTRINAAWAFIQKIFLPYLKGRISLALTNQNFRIYYLHFSHFSGKSQLILTWNKGQLVVPSGSD